MAKDIIQPDLLKTKTVNIDSIKVDEETIFDDGTHGNVIFFSVRNQTSSPIGLSFHDRSFLTVDGEELSANVWYTGYSLYENRIISANKFRKGGTIVVHDEGQKIFKTGAEFHLAFRDVTNQLDYDLYYKARLYRTAKAAAEDGLDFESSEINCSWELDEKKSTVKECKKEEDIEQNNEPDSSDMSENDKAISQKLKQNIQQMKALEKKLGIELENLSINYDSTRTYRVTVLGEVTETDPGIEHDSFTIHVVFYDKDNNIVDTDSEYICDFTVYDSFKIRAVSNGELASQIDHIRIYVKE